MPTIKYRIRKRGANSSIYLQLSLNREKIFERKTGLFCDSKNWSQETGFAKQNIASLKNLNSRLRNLQNVVYEKLWEANNDNIEINSRWLKHRIDIFFERATEDEKSLYLIDSIQYIINTANIRRNAKDDFGLSTSRINDYKRLKDIISEYETRIRRRIKVKDISPSFVKDFENYFVNDLKYSVSYAHRTVSNIKSVCFDAEENDIPISNKLKHIKTKKSKNKYVIFFNAKELQQIEETHFTLDYLENAKKWLLIGCGLGLRGNDLLSLSDSDILRFNDIIIIKKINQKTNKVSEIPVTPRIERLIKNGLPRKISQQKLNDYIKIVCEKAGINTMTKGKKSTLVEFERNGKKIKERRYKTGTYPKHELVSTHIFRRTFVTLNSANVPNLDLMKVTAHSTEKMLNNYKGTNSVTDIEYLQYLRKKLTLSEDKIFNNQKLKVI